MFDHFIRNLLLRRGLFVSKLTDDDQVKALVAKLKPHETDKQLIRVGGEKDGGYLVPDDLQGVEYCFSPGVAKTVAFEMDLAARGIRSFLADYSVDGPPVNSQMFHFEKRFLGAVDNDMVMTLETWIKKSIPNCAQDLILQMDIEGSEYDVILSTPDSVWRRFRIVVIEFHSLHSAFNSFGLRLIDHCFNRLLKIFDVVHIHPNNILPPLKRNSVEIPGVMEMTFLRKDRVKWRKPSANFPHPLDHPNIADKPNVVLPASWYR